LLYWWTKKLSDGKNGARVHQAWLPEKSKTDPIVKDRDQVEEDVDDHAITSALKALKSKGVNIVLVEIPRAEGWGHRRGGRLQKISEDSGVPLMEPGVVIAKKTNALHFTDGLHLDVPSAKIVSKQICDNLQELSRENTEKTQNRLR
jgi:hypothetical protein